MSTIMNFETFRDLVKAISYPIKFRELNLGRAFRIFTGIIAGYYLIKLIKRRSRDRSDLANMILTVSDQKYCLGNSPTQMRLINDLPNAICIQLAREYSNAFQENSLGFFVFPGTRGLRKHLLEKWFMVNVPVLQYLGQTRIFCVKHVRKEKKSEKYDLMPKPVCFAAVSRSFESQAGILDLVHAGNVFSIFELGFRNFLYSYLVRNWMLNLRNTVAPSSTYVCVEHMFVPYAYQGVGLGSQVRIRFFLSPISNLLVAVFEINH